MTIVDVTSFQFIYFAKVKKGEKGININQEAYKAWAILDTENWKVTHMRSEQKLMNKLILN